MEGGRIKRPIHPRITPPFPSKETLNELYISLKKEPALVFGVLITLPLYFICAIIFFGPPKLSSGHCTVVLCVLIVTFAIVIIFAIIHTSKKDNRQSVIVIRKEIDEKTKDYNFGKDGDSQ